MAPLTARPTIMVRILSTVDRLLSIRINISILLIITSTRT
jgi:hypothetical protein